MHKNILFFLLLTYICVSFLTNIKISNIPIHTYIILFSLFIAIPILKSSIIQIFYNPNYKSLKFLLYFSFTIFIILIYHDLSNDQSTGIIKGISIIIYVSYSMVLRYILSEEKKIKIINYLLVFMALIFSILFILTYTGDEKINLFIFTTRTNIAWFILFLFITIEIKNKKYEVLFTIFILFVLLYDSSKGPILAMLLILLFKYKHLIVKKMGILYISVFFVLATILFFNFSENFLLAIERFSNLFNLNYRSSSAYRISVIIDGFNFAKDFVLGQGFDSFSKTFYHVSSLNLSTKKNMYTADNTFIELLFDVGWIPIILLILFLKTLLKKNIDLQILFIFLSIYLIVDTITYNNFVLFLIILYLILKIKKSELSNNNIKGIYQ
jgi:hypothetical protein